MMKTCIRCKNEISESAKFCPFCGAKQTSSADSKEIKSRFCTECGRAWKEGEKFCPVCGEEYRADPMLPTDNEKTQQVKDTTEFSQNSIEYETEQTNSKLLKIIGIIFGVINVYNCFTNLPRLGYFATSDKVWGFGMILACAWCSVILFIVALRCKKEYGMTLFYALSCGEILKAILVAIQIRQIMKYQYWNLSSITYLPLIGAICSVLIFYYLMKHENVLMKHDNWKMIDYIKNIPTVLKNIWRRDTNITVGQGNTEKVYNNDSMSQLEKRIIPETESDKMLLVVNTGSFVALGILYTIDLVYGLLTPFSFIKLITKLFPILTCIAIWRIYFSGKKGELNAPGFSTISVLTWIKAIAHIAIGVLLLIVGGSLGVQAILIILIVMAIDIGYWCSLGSTLSAMKINARKGYKTIEVRLYPIFVLGINAFIKAAMFAWASFLQNTANSINGNLNQYGNTASNVVGNLFGELGLGYGTGYNWASSEIQSLLNTITTWVQDTLGFSQNPLIMIIAIAIPVLELLLLLKLRSYRKTNM